MIVNVGCSSSSGRSFFAHFLKKYLTLLSEEEVDLFLNPDSFEDYPYLKEGTSLSENVGFIAPIARIELLSFVARMTQ